MVRLKTEQNCGKYKRILKVFLLVKGFVFLCVYQYLSYTSTMANSNLINVTKSVLYASPSSVSLASIVQPEEKYVIDVCLKISCMYNTCPLKSVIQKDIFQKDVLNRRVINSMKNKQNFNVSLKNL